MKIPAFFRHLTALLVIFCLLSLSIVAAGFKKGEKEFKEGMKHEVAQEWDQAAEQFALAVTANPKNAEYRLHLHRALFNASQMFVQRGNALAEQKDYVGAYNAFRRAFAYDPTNQLARAEMDRMVRLQGDLENGVKLPGDKSNDSVSLVQTAYRPGDMKPGAYISQKLEKVGNYKYAEGSPLKDAIKQLAEELELNVLFDKGTPWKDRTFGINLKDVSAARALDYIFKQESLFFQKVGPKTILVADQQRRQFFTELVLRTFYLANADPEAVSKIIQQAIPVQPGRTQTFVQIDKSTNSMTIRDTEENIRLMEKLIRSLDKDRAEVVMDVNIYEVNKRDLLKLGNQIGTADTLGNLGGFTGGFTPLNQAGINAAAALVGKGLRNSAMGPFLSVPGSALSALQTKGDTRLIASTQVHAFNNEESMARIGQRVPVRSAQFFTGNNNNTGGNGVVGDVFNYEQVGLTLKFTPIVFPNQDVQVKMSIESKDVSGEQTETPTFSERSITGTARVQNNKTLLLASVAQGTVDKQRTGLPLLGLIPVLGRLFSVPSNSNRQVDIVIAVTPRVLRAPIILPEDEEMRPTGSVVSPTSGSLEAMVYQEEREEYLASVRRANTSASLQTPGSNRVEIQLPDQKPELPGYVPSGGGMAKTSEGAETKTVTQTAEGETAGSNTENKTELVAVVSEPAVKLRPIETNVRTLDIGKALNASDDNTVTAKQTSLVETPAAEISPEAEFKFGAEIPEMVKGAKMILPVLVKSASPFRVAVLALKYDEQKLAVRSVTYGEIFGAEQFKSAVIPYLNKGGKTFVSLNSISSVSESGVLAYIEIEALADGKPQISFDGEAMNLLSPGGANFALNFK